MNCIMKNHLTRRKFLHRATAGYAGLAWLSCRQAPGAYAAEAAKPAALGGTPIHQGPWPTWPAWNPSWEPAVLDVLRSGKWFRGADVHVEEFEAAYAKLIGSRRCLATASGTTALIVSLHCLGVDAGDEVIVSPYTFIATYNAILISKALPVFADTDPDTLTMDPKTIEGRITDRTTAIMPVHIYGMPCEMDPINAVAKKRDLKVIEDACQAWLAEYRGKKCGVLGDLGCFSFQNSKHLPSGEGGAITGDDEGLIDRCNSFHNCGRAFGASKGERTYFTRGGNYRMQQFQAVILMQQFEKLIQETARRRENADRLTAGLREIPGIRTVRLPENSRAVWHLYPFRYEAEQFNGLSRNKFMEALKAEGIPCSSPYHEQYLDGLIDEAIASRGFKRLFGAGRLKAYRESLNELKGNRLTCETTVAFTQNLLLAEPSHMDHIIGAIRRIQANSAELAKA